EPHSPGGQYAIRVEAIQPATGRSRSRIAASREFAAAMSSYREGTRDGIVKGIDHLTRALPDYRGAQDAAAEARVLFNLALFHAEAGDRDQAFAFANQAVPISKNARDALAEARALDALGQVTYYYGDRRKAITHYEQALSLMRTAGHRAAVGSTLSNLGVA